MRYPKPITLVFFFVMIALSLAACQSNTPTPGQTPSIPTSAPTDTDPTLPQPTATQTPVPTRTLVMCLTSEPQTLYLYGGSSRSMWSVLEAIYDGPFDTRGYSVQPVILEEIPSLSNGAAVLQPVPVKEGDLVVDVDGNLAALAAGTRVLPAGCTRPDCALAWDGQGELSMDQLVVTFRLLPGLTWSDGAALTAADSVFSYQVAADPATPSSKMVIDRTLSYEATDDLTVVWTGLPGYYEQRFGTFFFLPLPRHILEGKSPAQLLEDPELARKPIGWGPYMIEEWVPGDNITLRKNPNYFRAAEGLPAFDHLVIRFIGEAPDGNMNAILAGECDVVDQNPQFLEMYPDLAQRVAENKLDLHIGQGPEWEHLDFGIRPAAYDDGYNPGDGDRPDFFGDRRVRQAFAYCIDRAGLNTNLLYNRSVVLNSFLPPAHPLYPDELPAYEYRPDEGQRLLEEVGWIDTDGDPATPRVAAGVTGVPDGTPFSIVYQTTEAGLRRESAEAVASSLRSCGIEVSVQAVNPGELFAPGPDGVVFGRKFDLVQFSWEASPRPNCLLYSSTQVPSASNSWIGANITGYSNPAFDNACASAYWSRPPDSDYAERNRQVQELFADELPVVPLYAHLKIAISRPDICGLEMDVTARSIFYNLEGIDYGENCQ